MQKRGWHGFLKLCLMTEDEEVLSDMFDIFFTPEERESLALRYLILKELLSEEKPQRQIAQELNVSIAKITRGSNELKRITPKFKQHLKKHLL